MDSNTKLKEKLERTISRTQQKQRITNKTRTEVSEEKELEQKVIKTKSRIKEKNDNRISFAH